MAAACAQTVEACPAELLKKLTAGQTFSARLSGYGFSDDSEYDDLNEFLVLLEQELSLTPDNAKITFDEEGNLVQILREYTPWN